MIKCECISVLWLILMSLDIDYITAILVRWPGKGREKKLDAGGSRPADVEFWHAYVQQRTYE